MRCQPHPSTVSYDGAAIHFPDVQRRSHISCSMLTFVWSFATLLLCAICHPRAHTRQLLGWTALHPTAPQYISSFGIWKNPKLRLHSQSAASEVFDDDSTGQAYPRAKRVRIESNSKLITAGAEDRRARLDAELMKAGLDPAQMDTEEFMGSSAQRAYRSFVYPKDNDALAITEDPSRARVVANQVAFLMREQRAHNAEYLRNVDLRQKEREAVKLQSFPLTIVLDNIRSAENVGMMFRVAETAGVKEIITCGFTPHPPNPKLLKTALSAVEYVPTRHFSSTAEAIKALQSEGTTAWACETTADAVLHSEAEYPENVALVLGNEVIGVDTTVLQMCTKTLRIPTFGIKNSLNVGTAMSVLVYEVLRQWNAFPSRTP